MTGQYRGHNATHIRGFHIPFNFIRGRKYIGARIRGSLINIVTVISLSPFARLRPLDIQMSAGISGLTRFSASKYYLPSPPPSTAIQPRPRTPSSRRRPSNLDARKKYKTSCRHQPRVDLSVNADLFIPARLNDSITDRVGSSRSLHRKRLRRSGRRQPLAENRTLSFDVSSNVSRRPVERFAV